MSPEQLNKAQEHLNHRYQKQRELFEETDPVVKELTEDLWQRLISEKRIDMGEARKAAHMINMDTIRHSNVREIGAECPPDRTGRDELYYMESTKTFRTPSNSGMGSV